MYMIWSLATIISIIIIHSSRFKKIQNRHGLQLMLLRPVKAYFQTKNSHLHTCNNKYQKIQIGHGPWLVTKKSEFILFLFDSEVLCLTQWAYDWLHKFCSYPANLTGFLLFNGSRRVHLGPSQTCWFQVKLTHFGHGSGRFNESWVDSESPVTMIKAYLVFPFL